MEKDFISLFFENSWWLPQIIMAAIFASAIIMPFALLPRIIRAWRTPPAVPPNTLLSITQDDGHWIIYLNKQAPLPLQALTETTHNYLLPND